LSAFDPRAQLPGALDALGLALSARAQDQLLAHLSLIGKWGRVYNLTALRDPAEMFTHHLLDSLAAVRPLAAHLTARGAPHPAVAQPAPSAGATAGCHVLDVGSGAGLPGVTLAIALGEVLAGMDSPSARGLKPVPVRVTCVDAVAKKAGFIRQVAAELGLSPLQAVHGRIESLKMVPADVITCRAFASLSDIVGLTQAHLAPGGVWMALKGVTPQDEIADLPAAVEVFHVEPLQVPHLDAQRCLVWMRRRATTGFS